VTPKHIENPAYGRIFFVKCSICFIFDLIMGISSISIIPKISVFPDKELKIKLILDWLITLDIIKPELSACLLGPDDLGYSISQGAEFVVEEPKYLPTTFTTNGLGIDRSRNIFTSMEGGLDHLICPTCDAEIMTSFRNGTTVKMKIFVAQTAILPLISMIIHLYRNGVSAILGLHSGIGRNSGRNLLMSFQKSSELPSPLYMPTFNSLEDLP
jgi:hypothetical protein